MPEAVIGLDVGKSSHWACVATRDGEVLLSAPVANREDDLDSLFGRFPDALVVVDQSRNIGALALARARAAGMSAALTRGAARGKIEALVRSTTSSTRPDASVVAAEDRAVKLLARRISEHSAEIEAITAEISALLEGDDTYRCLLTVPGIGPKTASELAISIDIEDFPSHDRLASYCGLAPRNRQSGTSISSVTASRQGNKRLKNLLIFSCNCLTRTEGRWGDYYTRCRERGMSHGKALKALARKRLKVIYAVMRDRVPYAA